MASRRAFTVVASDGSRQNAYRSGVDAPVRSVRLATHNDVAQERGRDARLSTAMCAVVITGLSLATWTGVGAAVWGLMHI